MGTSGSISTATSGAIEDLSADYHDYWVMRQPNIIVIGVDDTMLATFTPASLPPEAEWVFNRRCSPSSTSRSVTGPGRRMRPRPGL